MTMSLLLDSVLIFVSMTISERYESGDFITDKRFTRHELPNLSQQLHDIVSLLL